MSTLWKLWSSVSFAHNLKYHSHAYHGQYIKVFFTQQVLNYRLLQNHMLPDITQWAGRFPYLLSVRLALINPATVTSTYPSLIVQASSSCHSLKDTASASIISILLQCHTCSFISHPIAGIVSIARRRALSPTSLSCAPRCGPLSHPLSAGNYTHLKPITTSKGTGTGK